MAWAAPQQGPGEAAAPRRGLGARLCHRQLQEEEGGTRGAVPGGSRAVEPSLSRAVTAGSLLCPLVSPSGEQAADPEPADGEQRQRCLRRRADDFPGRACC